MPRLLPYDRAAAVRYAARWALSRNPDYPDFSYLGGDCANFASQCLLAGCRGMNYTRDTGWYYRSMADRAPAWSSARFLRRFLLRTSGPGPAGTPADLSELLPGDLIFLAQNGRPYHTLLVVAAGEDPLIAAHTIDSWMRPLADYGSVSRLPVHIAGVRGREVSR